MGNCASCSVCDSREKEEQHRFDSSLGGERAAQTYLRTSSRQSPVEFTGVLEEPHGIPAGLPMISKQPKSGSNVVTSAVPTAASSPIPSPACENSHAALPADGGHPLGRKRLSVSSPQVTAEGQSGSGSTIQPRRYFSKATGDSASPNSSMKLPHVVVRSPANTAAASGGGGSGRTPNPLHTINFHELHQQQVQVVRERLIQQQEKQRKNATMMPVLHTATASPRVEGSAASSGGCPHLRQRRSSLRSDRSLSMGLPNVAGMSHSAGANVIVAPHCSETSDIQLVRPVSAQIRESVGSWLLLQPRVAPEPIPEASVALQSEGQPDRSASLLVGSPLVGQESALGSSLRGGEFEEAPASGLIDFPCEEDERASAPAEFVLRMPVFHHAATDSGELI